VLLFGEVLIDNFPDHAVLGGAPFNVARHLRAFGLNPLLVSRTGNDAHHRRLLDAMQRYDMQTIGVQCDQRRPTGQVAVEMTDGGHRFEILPDQAYDYIHPAVARMVALAERPELVYFGTLAQRQPVSRRALSAVLACSDAPRLLDINLRQPWFDAVVVRRSLELADWVKVNAEELAQLRQLLDLPAGDARFLASVLIERYRLDSLLVTRGAEGAWLLQRDGSEAQVPGRRGVEVVDSVGAGDGFAAVFILGRLCGWPAALTLQRANAFAAAICGLRGAVPEQAEFYVPFLQAWQQVGGRAA